MKNILKILDIAKEKQEKDFDTVFIICGQEGSSKSHLALQCLDYLGGDIDKISLDQNDFVQSLQSCKDGDTLVFDEAGDGLFSRDFASAMSKQLVKLFMVIRGKRLITFLVLPSFFMIDAYFRKHRIRGLFYVYKRGRVAFFNQDKMKKIIMWGERNQNLWVTKPNFYDYFPIYKGKMLEDYRAKKKKKIQETIDNMNMANSKEGSKTALIKKLILDGMKNIDIANTLKCNVNYVSQVKSSIRNDVIKTGYKGNVGRFKKEAIEESI